MWTNDETTTRVFRLDDGTLVDWQRISAALNSAIEGCLELGNLRVVTSTIAAVFGDADVVQTSEGGLSKLYVAAVWQRVAGGVASASDCHALWSLFFSVYGR